MLLRGKDWAFYTDGYRVQWVLMRLNSQGRSYGGNIVDVEVIQFSQQEVFIQNLSDDFIFSSIVD